MSDSYSFLSKNFVLSECKDTKKCETYDFSISHFFIHFLSCSLFQQQFHHIVRLGRNLREFQQYPFVILRETYGSTVHKLSGFLYLRLQWNVKGSILTIKYMDEQAVALTGSQATHRRWNGQRRLTRRSCSTKMKMPGRSA